MKKVLSAILTFALLCTSAVALSGCSENKEATEAKVVASVDDLAGATIGVQLGTTGDIFASDIEDATVERYNKGTDAVSALKQGKIDCVIIDEQPAKVFVNNNSDLTILEEPFAVEEYAICLAKDNTELRDKINDALAELKEEGTLDDIINNYIGEDAGKTPYKSPDDVERTNGTLKMATNAEFPPYEYMESGNIVGIDVDMAQAIADKLGMELKVDNIEFDAIITAVSTGKADIGVAGLTVTEDRLENVNFTDSYTTSKQVIIVRKK